VRRILVSLSLPAAFAVGALTGFLASGARATPTLAGTIRYASYNSQALDGSVHYAVYLPPGYQSAVLRYPVVYFLHGLPATAKSYQSIDPIAQALEEAGDGRSRSASRVRAQTTPTPSG
jgi:S-formylglutathione hydrolase FrmB